ncbi:MFS multidrug transporter, putative [Cordyceps militaris CM01]|uniref:MFS multidrug transporter, putative n=1 Tax=Cordyceps militaris (strain CM01) TaxID=983644 RepID=G3J408_CORMM|nr:MFS multidrug transporter, putative [Cordyceps militaris CM01]EGX95783.1 MFS multidrug transporter, putative [Cordyceps militaris CM01]
MGLTQVTEVPVDCPSDEQPQPPRQTSAARFWLLSVGICIGLFLSIIDSSIVATALYTIGTEFHDLPNVNWIALAYTLAYLGCAVAFARLSDVIGRRNAFYLAYFLFLSFSMGSGFAQNIQQIIALRTLQGIGGSGLYSLTMIILPEMCPPSHLKFIGSLIGIVITISGVLGPVLGGLLTQFTGWRWIFWINGPISAISAGILWLCWPSEEHYIPAKRLLWKNFDYFGTFLIIAAAVLVVFAFQKAGTHELDTFNRAAFIAPITIGLLCWIAVFGWAFLAHKGKLKPDLVPALPFDLFRNRFYTSAALTTLLIGFPYLQIIFTFPTRAQIVSGKSVLVSGLELLPMIGGSALGSVLGGMINGKKNFLFETIATGCCLTLLGCGLLSTVHGKADDAKALGFLVFAGLGFGLSTAAATMLVSFEASIANAAPAHGILAQMRILGGSLGIATASIILRNKLKMTGMMSRGGGKLTTDELKGGPNHDIERAYSAAFRTDMTISTIICGIAVLVSILGFRRTRVDMNEQRAKLFREEQVRRAAVNVSSNENMDSTRK